MKLRVMLAIACLGAISIFLAACYRRRSKEEEEEEKDNAGNEFSSRDCCLDFETKPQNRFKRVLADNSYAPFKHLKREGRDESSTNLHPYEKEITSLLEHPPTPVELVIGSEKLHMVSSYTWVSTESQLQELAGLLSREQFFAVDTEQHSACSFLGLTALIQISTQKEDYLLDAIALHDTMDILHAVFANPSICKVFHGSDNDVLWLQRDFHIYVVNLFDTAKACEVLQKPQKSLAYLLETYCGVSTNKMLQREDWRQRPLSEEMVHYARTDAHYLLYIANCLVEELKSKSMEKCPSDKFSFVVEASRRSNMACLQLYVKDTDASPGDSAAASIFSRYLQGSGYQFTNIYEAQELARKLCTWRDLMARIHDEGLRYVLSDQAVAALVRTVPMTSNGIYDTIVKADLGVDSSSLTHSLPFPSPIACSHLKEFFDLLRQETFDSEDFFSKIIQKHLGPNGTCRLSVFNYALLSKSLKLTSGSFSKQNGGKPTKQAGRKASRELFVQKFSCKSPVYHNCRIFASDGRLLCYCDRKKLDWYLCRDLAKLVEEDPPAIMLRFEPKGRPEDEDNNFYIQSKKNICVGCGKGNHYLRYRIIPSCYRLHFPEHLKSHRSHDIVLLCVDCHEIAHAAAERHKKHIAAEFGIPLFVQKVVNPGEQVSETSGLDANPEEAGVSPLQLRTAAMALLRHGSKLPPNRREELIKVVREYYGGREVSEEDLEAALLVGMSPQERRRLKKKRGLHSNTHAGSNHAKKSSGNNLEEHLSVFPVSAVDGDSRKSNYSYISKESSFEKSDNKNSLDAMNPVALDISMYSKTNGGSCTVVEDCDKRGSSDTEHVRLLDTNNGQFGSGKLASGTNGASLCKYEQKQSLLGHGPHGKQVVEHLLKEYGEDGVRQFCQRWRQVFVEALNPRHLPAGWDIMHSGRRDFGEYSVYNPSKKP